MLRLLIFVTLLLIANTANATTRYLINGAGGTGCSNGASTYNPGTNSCGTGSDLVYTSPQNAAAVAVAGDIIEVRAGTYSTEYACTWATVIWCPVNSGTAGNPITIRAYNGETVTFSSPTADGITSAVDNHYPIYTNNKSYITIGGSGHGLNLSGGETGVLGYSGSTNISVMYNTITLAHMSGISIYGGSNNAIIEGNTLTQNSRINWPRGTAQAAGVNWGPAIFVGGGSSNSIVQDNWVYFNHGEGIVACSEPGCQNHLFQRNIIADNWGVNLYCDGCQSSKFDRNFSYVSTDLRNWSPGSQYSNSVPLGIAASNENIDQPGVDGLIVTNNITVNTGAGFWAFGCASGCSGQSVVDHTFRNFRIMNNTFVGDTNGIKFDYPTGHIDAITIQNNIVARHNDTGSVIAQINPTISTTHTFSNNIYSGTALTTFAYPSTLVNFASWASATGETNSGTSDPQLVNATVVPCRLWSDPSLSAPCSKATLLAQISNYALQSGSPARDAGADVSAFVTTDYNGVARPINNIFDIGAFEFQSSGSAPSIVIVSPSQTGTYATTTSTVDISGTASDDVAVTSVTWACPTCTPTSGTATGTTSWSQSGITLASGANTITFTASDGTLTTNAVIVVTKNTTANALVLKMLMSEGSGSTVADLSGTGNDGTTDCTWSSQGKHGFGITFDSACAITVPDDNTLDFTTGFSFEAWVFPTDTSRKRAVVTKNYIAYLYSSFDGFCAAGTGAQLGGLDDNGPHTACFAPPLTTNQWTHIALTYDGATIKMYRNGTLVDSTSYIGSMAIGTGTLQIGNNQFSEGFIGVIDDVYIYNYAVDQAQIQTDSTTGDTPAVTIMIDAGSSIKLGASSSIQVGQ